MISRRSALLIATAVLAPAKAGAGQGFRDAARDVPRDVSPWAGEREAGVRLVRGAAAGAMLRAGLEFRLAPGWHTYWRYPGDSGVPPTFDWQGSENLAGVEVLWPMPERISSGRGATSIGYKREVILPLRITPREPGRPVVLRLALAYAACETLCVPMAGRMALVLDPAAPRGSQEERLARFEAQVPTAVAFGDASAGLAVTSLSRDRSRTPHRVLVKLKAAAGLPVELFAEGPDDRWALPLPRAVDGGEAHLFVVDLDGVPHGTDATAPIDLRLTAAAGDRAVEVRARLD